MPEISNLVTSKHVIAYLEIMLDSCDISDEGTLKRLYALYHNVYENVKALSRDTNHRSFSVKIFSHCIVFMDELEYPDDDQDYFPRHSKENSISLMLQFVSDFQSMASKYYNLLVKGYATIGNLFRPQSREWDDENGEHHKIEALDLDFIWGKALVNADTIVEKLTEPHIIIDDEICAYIMEQFGDAYYHLFVHKNPILGKMCINQDTGFTAVPTADEINNQCDNASNFTKSYVLHIDLLGSKKKINEDCTNHTDRWLNNLRDIYNAAIGRTNQHSSLLLSQSEYMNFEASASFKTGIFSDNIIVSYPILADNGMGLNHLIVFAGYFQAYALQKYQWMCYGYITTGEIYLDKECIYGPVFKQLIDKENSPEHLPRIEVDTQVEHYGISLASLLTTCDEDQTQIVNYLATIAMNENGNPPHNPILPGNGFIQEMRNILPKYLNSSTDDKVRKKIKWAIAFHNKFTDNNEGYEEFRIPEN